jgi:hypothetical protein
MQGRSVSFHWVPTLSGCPGSAHVDFGFWPPGGLLSALPQSVRTHSVV